MVTKYIANPLVEYAEPNCYAYATWVPDDPDYGLQWHLDNATHGGINMEDARVIEPGGTPDVVVAAVDSGVAYEDLKARASGIVIPTMPTEIQAIPGGAG